MVTALKLYFTHKFDGWMDFNLKNIGERMDNTNDTRNTSVLQQKRKEKNFQIIALIDTCNCNLNKYHKLLSILLRLLQ